MVYGPPGTGKTVIMIEWSVSKQMSMFAGGM
jgi:KaiC/GvpD/RAD55 family RecA-like ATPase